MRMVSPARAFSGTRTDRLRGEPAVPGPGVPVTVQSGWFSTSAGAPADVENHPDWTVTGTPGPGTAGSPRSLSVRVPENARAGDTMRIYHGVTGEVFSCAVPPGGEGQTLLVPI